MSIPANITKGDILKAIDSISLSEIPVNRSSREYFLKYKGRILPPKYVISIANKYANKLELESKLFNAIEAKNYLEKLGFEIGFNSQKTMPNFWIEKTIVKGRPDRENGDRALGKALWSPQKDKRGADIYRNMRLVKPGDYILHLIDNKEISGVSIVLKSAIETDGVLGTDWEGDSYLIELRDYIPLEKPIDRNEILNSSNKNILEKISSSSEVFYNNKLELRQGAYLTPCPPRLAKLINNIYKSSNGKSLPYFESFQFEGMNKDSISNQKFNIISFNISLKKSGLLFSDKLISRFISSLVTKPFVILTGLSGSGKTKLAQTFVQWICQDKSQYRIVPVGADWTNREPLLGYPNALKPEEYVKPDSGVLELIIDACEEENTEKPYFLILDEMNLSQVERYFADFLSVMESKEEIPLFAEGTVENGVPANLRIPPNLFIIGTVNIDETTNMFSPKVLDRANTIEFRVTKEEMDGFLNNIQDIDMGSLYANGAGMAKDFLRLASNKTFETNDIETINGKLLKFFSELKKTGAEFGYRSASEILRLINQLTVLDENLTTNEKLDIAIMQKLLPKLHGSRRKLTPILKALGLFCFEEEINIEKDVFEKDDFNFNASNVLFPLALEKISRMHKGAVDNGYSSFAEA